MTKIEWTEVTWNPTTGCDRVSPGCDHCYALTMAKRLKAMGSEKYQRDGDPRTSGPGFGVTEHPAVLLQPFSWKKPKRVFVNSMSDLFHAEVSEAFIAEVFGVMAANYEHDGPTHTFQILTKRHARMRSLLRDDRFRDAVAIAAAQRSENADAVHDAVRFDHWPLSNVWLGVSVEDQHWADIRIPALMETPAAVRFISAEPLLGPVKFSRLHSHCPTHDFAAGFCTGPCPDRRLPDWVIVGGESGPGARPVAPDWVRSIRDDCTAAGIAFFFKQWGAWGPTTQVGAGVGEPDEVCLPDSSIKPLPLPSGTTFQEGRWFKRVGKSAAGRTLDGRTWDEFPS